MIEGRHEIACIEYSLNEDDSLQFILAHHKIRRGWNDFIRIRLALTLKPSFQQRALQNMRAGGKLKGLANLPDVQRIDVRQEIADIAAVCLRNVGNAETILQVAHPTLIEALVNGTLKINRAMDLCKLPHSKQLDELVRHSEERATSKIIRRFLVQPRKSELSLDAGTVLKALRSREEFHSGSVSVRIVRQQCTVISGRSRFARRNQFSKGATSEMKYHSPLKRILRETRSYWDQDGIRNSVQKVFASALQCRTPELGAERPSARASTECSLGYSGIYSLPYLQIASLPKLR